MKNRSEQARDESIKGPVIIDASYAIDLLRGNTQGSPSWRELVYGKDEFAHYLQLAWYRIGHLLGVKYIWGHDSMQLARGIFLIEVRLSSPVLLWNSISFQECSIAATIA